MTRITLFSLAFLTLGQVIPGCPTGTTGSSNSSVDRGEIATAASGPASAALKDDTVTLAATASGDEAGGVISYSWVQVAGPGVKLSNSDTANPSFKAPALSQRQTLRFMVTTRNELGDVGRSTVDVVVEASSSGGGPSGGPVARAGSDKAADEGAVVTLDGSASTGTGLRFAWAQTAGTPAITLSGANTSIATLTAPGFAEGANQFTFELTVTDGQSRMARDSVVVTVNKIDTNRKTKVRFDTSMGDIVVELEDAKAPITVANFLRYVDEGFYVDTAFHRIVKDFVDQGGGYDRDLTLKVTHEPIALETTGLSNVRGTIAMARTSEPNSATSQFFFNVKDNSATLDPEGSNPGYAVFGTIIAGLDVMDAMNAVETTNVGLPPDMLEDVPLDTIVIFSVTREP